jgi:hypothetical protein
LARPLGYPWTDIVNEILAEREGRNAASQKSARSAHFILVYDVMRLFEAFEIDDRYPGRDTPNSMAVKPGVGQKSASLIEVLKK